MTTLQVVRAADNPLGHGPGVLPEDVTRRLLGELNDIAGRDVEVVLLATCARLELILAGARASAVAPALFAHLWAACPAPTGALPSLRTLTGDKAARELMAVATGLRSPAIGETEILGQVRRALRLAQDAGTAGRMTMGSIERAIRAARAARADSGIDVGAIGLGATIAAVIAEALPAESARPARIAVIGTGSLARATLGELEHLADAHVALVASRRRAAAEALVGNTTAVVDLADLPQHLEDVDVLVSATSGRVGLPPALTGHLTQIIDAGAPPTLDLPGAAVVGLAQLDARRVGVRRARRAAVARAEHLLDQHVLEWQQWVAATGNASHVAELMCAAGRAERRGVPRQVARAAAHRHVHAVRRDGRAALAAAVQDLRELAPAAV